MAVVRKENNMPGERNKAEKMLLRHKTRIIEYCNHILRDPNASMELRETTRELMKEVSKI